MANHSFQTWLEQKDPELYDETIGQKFKDLARAGVLGASMLSPFAGSGEAKGAGLVYKGAPSYNYAGTSDDPDVQRAREELEDAADQKFDYSKGKAPLGKVSWPLRTVFGSQRKVRSSLQDAAAGTDFGSVEDAEKWLVEKARIGEWDRDAKYSLPQVGPKGASEEENRTRLFGIIKQMEQKVKDINQGKIPDDGYVFEYDKTRKALKKVLRATSKYRDLGGDVRAPSPYKNPVTKKYPGLGPS